MTKVDPRLALASKAQLQLEIEALRMANNALEKQLIADAERYENLLQHMETTAQTLTAVNSELHAQSHFTQRVMDSTGALMFVLSSKGDLVQINKSASEILGLPLGDTTGLTLDHWFKSEERECLKAALPDLPWPVLSPLYETVRRQGRYRSEHSLRHPGGEYRTYLVEATVQHSPQGKEEGAVVCATDISPLKHEQLQLTQNKELLNEAQRIAQMAHWTSDANENGDLWCWSEQAKQNLQLAAESMPDNLPGFLEWLPQIDRDKLSKAYETTRVQGTPSDLVHRLLVEKSGDPRWVHHRIERIVDEKTQNARCFGTLLDITEQIKANEQISLAASVFDNSLNGILITTPDGQILNVNDAFCEMTGYDRHELLGANPSLLKSNRHSAHFYRQLWRALITDGHWQGEIWDRRKDGEVIPLWQNISAVYNDAQELIHYVSVSYDLSEQKEAAENIHRLAYFDTLTQLPNRQHFMDSCSQAIRDAHRDSRSLAILFLDLDRFKHINDSMGHPTGDKLLRIVAQRLTGCLRESDIVARLGGDEFVILIEDFHNRRDLELIAEKVQSQLSSPHNVEGYRLVIGTSIGVSCFPDDGLDAISLIKHADLAMYHAKTQGRGNYQFYESSMSARARDRLELEVAMRDAITHEGFFLVYQPQYSLDNGQLVGVEALIRWNDPTRGFIPPDRFIPVAEDCGLIIDIGEWVLRTACTQAKNWLEAGCELQRIAVNLSGLQIERGDIAQKVSWILHETGLPAHYLELEITETYIMQEAERNIALLHQLRDLGVTLAVDDFGTGQSSLSYLKRLPVNKLKIDRSFVMDIPQDNNDMAITKAILALGHSLQMNVLAEGVETREQARFLKQLGCDEVQGYYYSKPVTADVIENLCQENRQLAAGDTISIHTATK